MDVGDEGQVEFGPAPGRRPGAGRAERNVIFLCLGCFFFAWRNWGEGDQGAPV